MKIKRRDFLKTMAGSAALAAVPVNAMASEDHERTETHVGILYDSTLCMGCQSCMVTCRQTNLMKGDKSEPLEIWDNPVDLSANTLNIIQKYENGNKEVKDREVDGYAFVKKQCLHCVDPACVSACPASAMIKDEETGIVTYDKEACIGCRYCQVACQFNIPKFEWDEPFPEIVKCQMCAPLVWEGKNPACSDVCPTGATLFGHVSELLEETKRRKAMTPGDLYDFPLASIDSGRSVRRKTAKYIDHVYGEKEIGGTQVLYMAGVPFDLLGLPKLPEKSYASISESIQHTLYKGMLAPLALFCGVVFMVAKNNNHND